MSGAAIGLFSLTGKVAVITGGAGMLGQMHAEAIADAGGSVALVDIRGAAAEDAARRLRETFRVPARGFQADITNKAEVERLLVAVVETFGQVDILINNAAHDPKVTPDSGAAWTRFENYSLELWHRDLAVGLTGAFLCSQAFGSRMAGSDGGVILNISSDLGLIGPDQRIYERANLEPHEQPTKPVSYSVVKTGLIGLTRFLATYWADRGVRVNALCPGGVEAGQPDEFKRRVTFRIPLARMARQDEYKGAVLFLVSDASSYVTGATIVADGGRSCW
jgi:NAD(P)-dependent dehydrogenase (short-subunit alcohol dehydrogenase family)